MPPALAERLAAERERWALWMPVAIGLGIGLYFALPSEPPRQVGLVLAGLCAVVAWLGRARSWLLVPALAGTLIAAGLCLATWRTDRVAAPVLAERVGPATVIGRVVDTDRTERGFRVTLDHVSIWRHDPADTPARARITLKPGEAAPAIGAWIRLRAVLSPPGAPYEPGGFDFARYAFYRQLGGLGFAVSEVRAARPMATPGFEPILMLRRWQADLTDRIERALPGPAGAIAAALMTGERSGIPDEVNTAMQLSGLAHLLSISGLHLALVAGILFFGTRFALAAIEWVALRWPIKKIAAAAALAGAFAYMLVSGAAVPTQRAFLMTAVVLIAVMLDRSALSMRLVALAALVVLVVQPDALLEASFQMSFAAVVALIAAFEHAAPWLAARRRRAGWLAKASFWIGGIALTSLIAGTASGLYALWHFNRFVHYGVIANLIVDPLTAFWIMPLAVIAFVLMPFGLEHLALTPMGWGIEALLWVAQWIAGWPLASTSYAALPLWSLLAMTAGGLWLCIWRTGWRWWGLAGLVAALVPLGWPDRPDIRIDGSGRVVALRGGEGDLLVSSGRAGRAVTTAWARRDGEVPRTTFPRQGPSADGRLRCDATACLWRYDGWLVALPRGPADVDEDCRRADLVIATFPVEGRCAAARHVIDRADLAREGAHAIRLRSDGTLDLRTVNRERGRRPWTGAQENTEKDPDEP
ncbi:ComEC/Rec2 family competence protein [Desertibaculum subflavum]|uniref:ComEC/Rec2 family competence protein n=1 Tax=Desertibaculum subflavum TaxID=2268458 RepID=UPI000E671365